MSLPRSLKEELKEQKEAELKVRQESKETPKKVKGRSKKSKDE